MAQMGGNVILAPLAARNPMVEDLDGNGYAILDLDRVETNALLGTISEEEIQQLDGAGLFVDDDGRLSVNSDVFDGDIEGLSNPLTEDLDAAGYNIDNAFSVSTEDVDADSVNTDHTDSNSINTDRAYDAGNFDTLQDAIDAAESDGVEIVTAPAGSYGAIVIPPGMSVLGPGVDSALSGGSDTQPAVEFAGNRGQLSGFTVENDEGLNITIDGNDNILFNARMRGDNREMEIGGERNRIVANDLNATTVTLTESSSDNVVRTNAGPTVVDDGTNEVGGNS